MHRLTSLVFAILAIAATPVWAQYSLNDGALSGTGQVTIERQPEVMRMSVQLLSTASSMKEALAALKTRQESTTAQVLALGAAKDSIKVEPAALVEAGNDRNRQMQRMMMQRMQGGNARKKTPAKVTEPVRLSTNFTADWPLKAKSHEELLAAVHDLQQKLRALDLAGAKEATKLSAEEQELMEEAEAEMAMYGNDNGEEPGKPQFVFVATIADADYEKALAEAFHKATAQAERLARITARKLGPLESVNVLDHMDSGDESGIYNRFGASAYNTLQRLRQRKGDNDLVTAVGLTPGSVKVNVSLTASFKLDEK